jgi:alkylation response protein AidB-like acyl-CoA dehydrogenase
MTSVMTSPDALHRSGPLNVARQVAPALRDRATEAQTLRTMPSDLVQDLKSAGQFRLALPAALGGWEADAMTIFNVVEELSSADGSAGWTVLIGNSTAFLAWLDPDVARELLDGDPDRSSTGVFAPLGRARPAGGEGFIVDGRWPCNSGCPHSELLMAGITVTDGDGPRLLPGGRPDTRLAWLPRPDVEILDTWHVAGLRGTGSHDITVRQARVPAAWTCAPLFDAPRHDGPLYRLSFYNLVATLMAGFPAGVARHALNLFMEIARTKRRGASDAALADSELVQVTVAAADGAVRAARAFFVDAIGAAWDTATKGDPSTLDERALVISATQTLFHAAVSAVDAVLPIAGASAIYEDDPLQRCAQDLHAARQHIFYSAENLKRVGKALLAVDQPQHLL